MMADRVAGATFAPLESWTAVHPAAAAAARGEIDLPPVPGQAISRSAALAEALSRANRSWGNPVDAELSRWLAGAEVVVTGQQPALLGGPLLTLVKAATVAAEVRRLRGAGREAVGFLWLATGDDDLPEMGWGRVAAGEELLEVREAGWGRGAQLGGSAPLSGACTAFLEDL
ncbi:MAG TPA: bacillithiol biosynthesis BshC, partial [Thermoanaerobaculaceae bacterium]|nr:bacillithiol biosynthesis BshC [Thermoanaerobaculaceae bacterium]